MSAPASLCPAPPETNQFIRPNKGEFDVFSAARSLASRGSNFAASPEYAEAISRGMGEELGQAIEQVLGRDGMDSLSQEDWNIVQFLTYGVDPAVQALPHTADAGGDEAAGSPATSVASAPCKTGTLSSKEDELSSDRTPMGEGAGAEPAKKVARGRRRVIRRLTRRVSKMAIDVDHVEIPEKGPGELPGPTGATLARGAGQSTAVRTVGRPPVPPVVRLQDVRDEMQGGGDVPGGGAPPGGGGDGWGGPPGGGGGGDGGDNNPDDDASMAEEPEDEDPTVGHAGKEYTPRTTKGREMAQMFRDFCGLPRSHANAIVVYFGVYTMDILAEFREEHWKDTFTNWQKRHPCPDGTERAMVLNPPHQDRIKCAAWACRYHNRISWPPRAFKKRGVAAPVSMITLLKKEHFEPIKAQMLREEHGKVALKDISELTDIPKFKTTTSMSKHIREFETFLSTKYGVDGFPLDYVLRPKLVDRPMSDLEDRIPDRWQYPTKTMPDFFDFAQTDEICRRWAPIIVGNRAGTVFGAPDHDLARIEDDVVLYRTPMFLRDDEIVFRLASVAFKDSPGGCHFVNKRGVIHHSGRKAFFACKGQFVGKDSARRECDYAREAIAKMQYEGESRNWGWDKHCEKFHSHIQVIDEWAASGLATRLSEADRISAFLQTIPKDCKNSELVIAKGIIEGDRSRFPTLISTVIPHLSLSIVSRERGTSDAKRTIANARSDPGRSSGKRRRTGQSRSTAGRLRLEGGKVVGTIEGLHYDKSIWDAMTKEQRDKAVELRKAKGSRRAAKAATTSGSNPPLSAVSDKVDKLARAVKRLETSTEDSGSADRNSKSRPSRGRSRSGSSSRSRGSNQSGAHSGRRKS